jgi:hypothetical protein
VATAQIGDKRRVGRVYQPADYVQVTLGQPADDVVGQWA